jgi:diguanylate cyclase (GGDEF)-like protein
VKALDLLVVRRRQFAMAGPLLAIVLIMSVASAKLLSDARSAMVAEIQRGELLTATERARALAEGLSTAESRIATTVRSGAVATAMASGQRALLRSALDETAGSPGLIGGAVVDAHGVLLASHGDIDIENVRTDRYRFELRHERPVVTLSTPIRDRSVIVGRLYESYDLKKLVPLVAANVPYASGAVTLATRDGVVLMSTADRRAPRIQAPVLRSALKHGRPKAVSYHSILFGSDRVGAVSPVPGTPVMIVVGADVDAANKPASALLSKLATTLLIAAVLTAAMVAALACLAMQSFRRLRARRSEAEHEANTDPLTLIGNRRSFDRAVRERSERPGSSSIVLVDVDHLKRLNDAHGHRVGDDAIRLVSQALIRSVRPGDLVARIGGDEFAVLLSSGDSDQALEVGRRINLALSDRPLPSAPVTISFGCATGPNSQLAALIGSADDALYAAKRRRHVQASR